MQRPWGGRECGAFENVQGGFQGWRRVGAGEGGEGREGLRVC